MSACGRLARAHGRIRSVAVIEAPGRNRPRFSRPDPGRERIEDEPGRKLNKKQLRVLAGIFAEPVRANIDWHDVESLLSALGAELSEGRGSRVRVALNGVRATFHKPHPQKGIPKGRVRSVRDFLISAGIQAPGGEAVR
jgi:hypothetical protein